MKKLVTVLFIISTVVATALVVRQETAVKAQDYAFNYTRWRPDPRNAIITEEFAGGTSGLGFGTSGNLGWRTQTIGSAPLLTGSGASIFPHPGTQNFSTATAATIGQGGTLILLSGDSTTSAMFTDISSVTGWEMNWIFKLNNAVTDTRFRIGGMTSTTTVQPVGGFWLRYDTNVSFADTNFMVCTRVTSGTEGCSDTTIPVDTLWHRIQFTELTAQALTWTLYNGSGVVQATGTMAGVLVQGNTESAAPGLVIATNATAQKVVILDYFSMYYPNLTR